MAKRNDFRKRYLVTEGDLFQLYANIMEVRSEEKKSQFMADFRKLLKESTKVRLVTER